jgi:hypothetical protein
MAGNIKPKHFRNGPVLVPIQRKKNTQDKSFFDSVAALHSPYSVEENHQMA